MFIYSYSDLYLELLIKSCMFVYISLQLKKHVYLYDQFYMYMHILSYIYISFIYNIDSNNHKYFQIPSLEWRITTLTTTLKYVYE